MSRGYSASADDHKTVKILPQKERISQPPEQEISWTMK